MTTATTSELLFNVHGVEVTVMTSSSLLADPVASLLRYFRRTRHEGTLPLTVVLEAVGNRAEIPVTIPATARRLFNQTGIASGDDQTSEWRCEVVQDEDRIIAEFHGQGVVVIDGQSRRASVYVIHPETKHEDVRVGYVHFALVELLKWQGIHTLHATALEKGGRGVLIPGYSGRGKTTSFIALLRSGYRYLSDDHPLIRRTAKGLELLPFPLKIDVTEPTISFFPELRGAPPTMFRQGIHKRYFYVEDLYSSGIGERCEPAVILFPHVVDCDRSRLERLPASRALEEILPHSLLVYDRDVAKREFSLLSQLVQQVECYRLHFGRDILDLPKLIDPLLKQHAGHG